MDTAKMHSDLMKGILLEGELNQMAFQCSRADGFEHCSDECELYRKRSTEWFELKWANLMAYGEQDQPVTKVTLSFLA